MLRSRGCSPCRRPPPAPRRVPTSLPPREDTGETGLQPGGGAVTNKCMLLISHPVCCSSRNKLRQLIKPDGSSMMLSALHTLSPELFTTTLTLSLLYGRENRDTERLRNRPEVTGSLPGRAGIQPKAAQPQEPCSEPWCQSGLPWRDTRGWVSGFRGATSAFRYA